MNSLPSREDWNCMKNTWVLMTFHLKQINFFQEKQMNDAQNNQYSLGKCHILDMIERKKKIEIKTNKPYTGFLEKMKNKFHDYISTVSDESKNSICSNFLLIFTFNGQAKYSTLYDNVKRSIKFVKCNDIKSFSFNDITPFLDKNRTCARPINVTKYNGNINRFSENCESNDINSQNNQINNKMETENSDINKFLPLTSLESESKFSTDFIVEIATLHKDGWLEIHAQNSIPVSKLFKHPTQKIQLQLLSNSGQLFSTCFIDTCFTFGAFGFGNSYKLSRYTDAFLNLMQHKNDENYPDYYNEYRHNNILKFHPLDDRTFLANVNLPKKDVKKEIDIENYWFDEFLEIIKNKRDIEMATSENVILKNYTFETMKQIHKEINSNKERKLNKLEQMITNFNPNDNSSFKWLQKSSRLNLYNCKLDDIQMEQDDFSDYDKVRRQMDLKEKILHFAPGIVTKKSKI
ncbi:hypothetical protein A3Q56_03196 [Intoshia linei]|uniref:Uncharacterized protein n=1 Tax=Intoshia linei TaxID=1819745 RepID=A0A177B4I0_9BILA|nr:hypothetical protein A3Q56_03196 [Intoshia linei]